MIRVSRPLTDRRSTEGRACHGCGQSKIVRAIKIGPLQGDLGPDDHQRQVNRGTAAYQPLYVQLCDQCLDELQRETHATLALYVPLTLPVATDLRATETVSDPTAEPLPDPGPGPAGGADGGAEGNRWTRCPSCGGDHKPDDACVIPMVKAPEAQEAFREAAGLPDAHPAKGVPGIGDLIDHLLTAYDRDKVRPVGVRNTLTQIEDRLKGS